MGSLGSELRTLQGGVGDVGGQFVWPEGPDPLAGCPSLQNSSVSVQGATSRCITSPRSVLFGMLTWVWGTSQKGIRADSVEPAVRRKPFCSSQSPESQRRSSLKVLTCSRGVGSLNKETTVGGQNGQICMCITGLSKTLGTCHVQCGSQDHTRPLPTRNSEVKSNSGVNSREAGDQ